MIKGLVGLNNVPKLLSIKPYDSNFITGRGFINQFQIDNLCRSSEDQVKNKANAIAHYSVKDDRLLSNNTPRNENFANIVRSSARNRISQACINNIVNNGQTITPTQTNYTNVNVVTPFKLSYFRK